MMANLLTIQVNKAYEPILNGTPRPMSQERYMAHLILLIPNIETSSSLPDTYDRRDNRWLRKTAP